MRALLALLVLGAIVAPALAGPCGHRYHRHGGYRYYGHGHHHRHYGHHYRRVTYPRYSYVRSYYPRYRYRYGCGYGHHYRYGYRYYTGAHYSNRYHYRVYPRISIAPFYTRYTTVLTLDDEAFDGPVSYDGTPQVRTKPVGDRFLVSE